MHWQYSPYIIPQLISTLISASVAVIAWRRRVVPGASALAVIMLGISQWSLATTLQWASADFGAQLFWFKFRFFGTELLSLMYLVMALQYTGRSQFLTRRNLALLLVMSLLSLSALWTNDAHHLFFSSAQLVQSGSFAALDVELGPWFWLHTAYDYLLLTSALLIFLRALLRSPQFYRAQLAAIMLSAVMPLSANILFVSNLSPFPYLDLTPLSFTLTGITYLLGFFRLHMWDITPAARDSVIENMSDGIIVVNDQQRIVDLNPAAARILGKPSKAIIAQPLVAVMPQWSQLNDMDTLGQTDLTLPAPDGTPRDYALRMSRVTDQHNRLTGRVLMLQDVTASKQSEAKLRLSQARFEDMAANITDSYYEADLTGVVTFANAAFCRALERAQSELEGHHFRHVVDRQDARHIIDAFSRVYQTGQPVKGLEYQFVRRDKTKRFADMSISLMRDGAGQPIGFRGVVRDVSERKQVEAELRQARTDAEAASQAKGAFLATVSHELRTPLTSVIGFAKLIQKRLDDVIFPAITSDAPKTQRAVRQVRENVDIIVKEGERLTTLINDVLDLSKIESGKMDWKLLPVSVPEVIERAIAATASLFTHKQLPIIRAVDDALPSTVATVIA